MLIQTLRILTISVNRNYCKNSVFKLAECFWKNSYVSMAAAKPPSLSNIHRNLTETGVTHERKTEETISALKKHGIHENHVDENPWLLEIPKDSLALKWSYIKQLKLNLDASIVLLQLPESGLMILASSCTRDIVKHKSEEHRIKFLAAALKVDEKVICQAFIKYKFLQKKSFPDLKSIVQVLLDYNVSSENILSDGWVLQYKAVSVAEQLQKAKDHGVEIIKPWMGRCPMSVLSKLLQKIDDKKKLLGDRSLTDYVGERLGCSHVEAGKLLKREPQLRKMNVVKMKEILDFLFQNGFTSKQILASVHRVVKRRKETLLARVVELQKLGCSPKTVYALGLSEKEYLRYIRSNQRKEERIKRRKTAKK